MGHAGKLMSKHAETCTGIPQTLPAKVTCDSKEQLYWLWNESTTAVTSASMWGVEQECQLKWADKMDRIFPGDGFTLAFSPPLFFFTCCTLHLTFLSEAVTPACHTSPTPHVAFLSSTEKPLVKWNRTKTCWLAPELAGERKSAGTRGSVDYCSLVVTPAGSFTQLSAAWLSTALKFECMLKSGWDYCTVEAHLWSDTLNLLAHSVSQQVKSKTRKFF